MFNPKIISLLFFISLLGFLLFYNRKNYKIKETKEYFNIKQDILSNIDVFTKYMLLNNY